MAFVFDADVLSTFAKIKKLNLLKRLFGKSQLLIPPAVLSDLARSKSPLVKAVIESKLFQHATLGRQESGLAKGIDSKKNLGRGEIECIAICKVRNFIFVTNDNKAIELAEAININTIDLETILYSLKNLVNKNQLKQIIYDIETKDKVVIINKKEILK